MIHKRMDIYTAILNYFLTQDSLFPRFYLLPETHKVLHNVPGEQSFLIMNIISKFLDFWTFIYNLLLNHISKLPMIS